MVDSTKIVAEWRAAIENNQNTAAHGKIDDKDGLYHDKDGNVIDSSAGRGQCQILGLAVSGPALYTFTQVEHFLGSRALEVRSSVFEVWEGFKDGKLFNVTCLALSSYITPSIHDGTCKGIERSENVISGYTNNGNLLFQDVSNRH